ncbi:MAG: ferredoxin family protein [bacterium]
MAKIVIETERCKGCRLCISVCPKKILVVEPVYNQKGYEPAGVADLEKCTGCALCAEMCPDICIRVWR